MEEISGPINRMCQDSMAGFVISGPHSNRLTEYAYGPTYLSDNMMDPDISILSKYFL